MLACMQDSCESNLKQVGLTLLRCAKSLSIFIYKPKKYQVLFPQSAEIYR